MAALITQSPFLILKFWFWEAPASIIEYFSALNTSFFQLFSFSLLLKTFFKPIKNEYRKGLVGFSIGMGMGIKSIIILVSLFLFLLLVISELIILIIFIAFPIFIFAIPFL